VVIDTGYASAWPDLEAQLQDEGIRVEDVAEILLTHGHPDHASGAEEIVARSGARVWLHRDDHPKLAPDYLELKAEQYLRLRPWFTREGVPADEFDAYVERFRAPRHRFTRDLEPRPLVDGQILDLAAGPLEVIATPGHTPGHVLLWDTARRIAFSGDHLLGDISPNPLLDFDEDDRRYPSFLDYLASLARIEDLDVDCWCPGHGPLFADAASVLRGLRQFYARRQEALARHAGGGGATCFQLSRALFPGAEGLDRFLAFSEVVGQVDDLVQRGALVEETDGGGRILQRP